MNVTEQFTYFNACAATGTEARADSVSFEALWEMAQAHNVTALIAKALQGTAAFEKADEAEKKRWRNALNNNIKKTMLFDAERKALLAYLEKEGIWYMPLKGVIINPLFPYFGTREFADNDILIDPSRMEDGKSFMLSHGYSFRSDDYSSDEYSKKPFFNFELHRELIEKTPQFASFYQYYENVKDRLVKEDGNAFGFRFTDDDFYIFFIFHAFKHYDNRGTGYRTVADTFVILHSDRFRLDFSYITKELDKLGIAEFEQKLHKLADSLFTDPENTAENLASLSPELREMLQYILSSGTFGNFGNLFAKEFEQSANGKPPSKAKYYLKRIFPERSRFQYSHPFVYKHRAIYPFFLIYRLAVNPIRHRRYLKREVRAINKIKK